MFWLVFNDSEFRFSLLSRGLPSLESKLRFCRDPHKRSSKMIHGFVLLNRKPSNAENKQKLLDWWGALALTVFHRASRIFSAIWKIRKIVERLYEHVCLLFNKADPNLWNKENHLKTCREPFYVSFEKIIGWQPLSPRSGKASFEWNDTFHKKQLFLGALPLEVYGLNFPTKSISKPWALSKWLS